MEKVILVPLDQSEIGKTMAQVAQNWAQSKGALVYFLRVTQEEESKDSEESIKAAFEEELKKIKLKGEYKVLHRIGTPYLEILKTVEEINCDLIFMAAHEHTMWGRLFLGSNSDYVLQHCRCPVYIFKNNMTLDRSKIVVPVDYTPINIKAIQIADKIAQRNNAELFFIHVEPIPPYPGPYKTEDTKLSEFIKTLNLQSKCHFDVEFGKPYLKIQELQQFTQAGLIVMSAHSHTMMDRMLVGSNTAFLLHHLICPMYIYKDHYSD
ncbi:MAG: universal stress protein [SAR324 cluster bacterium]|nr:universal stress protein [SAR324 cluster bacterium]